jgi:hypothetical protein
MASSLGRPICLDEKHQLQVLLPYSELVLPQHFRNPSHEAPCLTDFHGARSS